MLLFHSLDPKMAKKLYIRFEISPIYVVREHTWILSTRTRMNITIHIFSAANETFNKNAHQLRYAVLCCGQTVLKTYFIHLSMNTWISQWTDLSQTNSWSDELKWLFCIRATAPPKIWSQFSWMVKYYNLIADTTQAKIMCEFSVFFHATENKFDKKPRNYRVKTWMNVNNVNVCNGKLWNWNFDLYIKCYLKAEKCSHSS